MGSEDYQRFIDTFFGTGPDAAREGPDVDALLRLSPDEKVRAEQMLLERLSGGDSRPAIGLGALGSRAAAPHLRGLLRASAARVRGVEGGYVANVARALWQIDRSPEAMEKLRLVLAHSPFASVRMSAAQSMGDVRDPVAVDALALALQDDSLAVRGSAARSLVKMHGLDEGQPDPHPAVVRVARAQDPAERREAARSLMELVRAATLRPT